MLKTAVIEGTNVVSVTLDGSVSADEDTAAQNVFEDVAAKHGGARMLLDYEGIDLARVEPAAMWEDLKGARLLSVIDRIAVIADSPVLEAFAKAIGSLSDTDVRSYATDQRDAAVAWLSA